MHESSAPSDHTTLVGVLEGYAQDGFAESFSIDDDARVVCCTCGSTMAPGGVHLHSLRRLEGASDPADMAAVVALDCPVCGARGTAVVRFGPEASAAEAEVLASLEDQRLVTDDVPADQPTSEPAPAER